MLKLTLYIFPILILTNCVSSESKFNSKFVVFESDNSGGSIGFKPTTALIEKANQKLIECLETKIASNQTILVDGLDGKESLLDELKYYKRRYVGLLDENGDEIIKIEFVFVRCGGQDEWKHINYTKDNPDGCWWSVQYNLLS